jgi:hypothetical protein
LQYSSLGPDAVDASGSLGSLRFENLELRRKLDEVESEKTQLQQKHLTEVGGCRLLACKRLVYYLLIRLKSMNIIII